MKRKYISVISACLMLLCLAACQSEDERQSVTNGKVLLSLNVETQRGNRALRANETLPAKELMHTLRVIILSGDKVEHNELYTFEEATSEASHITFEVDPNQIKTVYLLANAESDGLNLDLDSEEGLTARINDCIVSQNYLEDADFLPMSSVYQYTVRDENAEFDAYVAYASTKFTFSIVNEMKDNAAIRFSDLYIYQIADQCFLLPRLVDNQDMWMDMLQSKQTITDYLMPERTLHDRFHYAEGETRTIAYGETYQLPAIYLPESKNMDPTTQLQNYSVSMGLATEKSDGSVSDDSGSEPLRPFELVDSENEPLASLFRCTHVDVRVIVKSLTEIEIETGLYGMIHDWETDEPHEGTIEEVKD